MANHNYQSSLSYATEGLPDVKREIGKIAGKLIYSDNVIGSSPKTGLIDQAEQEINNNDSTIFPVLRKVNQDYFILLQKWEGVVEDRLEKTFTARIKDVTSGGPDGFIEVDLDEISPQDFDLVYPGAYFQWYIGYNTRNSTRTKQSYFYFKRLPKVSKAEVLRTEKEAEDLYKIFNGD